MNLKPNALSLEKSAYCTVCGEDLKEQRLEKYQIRWDNKNSGVCQRCIVSLRKSFKTQRNKTPIKFRTKQFYELMEFDEQCVAMAESERGTILGEVRDSEDDSTLGVIIDDDAVYIDGTMGSVLELEYDEDPSDDELALIEASEEQD